MHSSQLSSSSLLLFTASRSKTPSFSLSLLSHTDSKMALTMRSAGLRAAAPARISRRSAVCVRASAEEPTPAAPVPETIATVSVPAATAAPTPAAAPAVAKAVSFGGEFHRARIVPASITFPSVVALVACRPHT
jgi:hypothetical protein